MTRPWPVKVSGFFITKNIPLHESEPLRRKPKATAVSNVGFFN
jgi:hypothetical protein